MNDPAAICHPTGATDYFRNSVKIFSAFPVMAVAENMFCTPFILIIYLPLLFYCRRKIDGKVTPIAVSGSITALVLLYFYGHVIHMDNMYATAPLVVTFTASIGLRAIIEFRTKNE